MSLLGEAQAAIGHNNVVLLLIRTRRLCFHCLVLWFLPTEFCTFPHEALPHILLHWYLSCLLFSSALYFIPVKFCLYRFLRWNSKLHYYLDEKWFSPLCSHNPPTPADTNQIYLKYLVVWGFGQLPMCPVSARLQTENYGPVSPFKLYAVFYKWFSHRHPTYNLVYLQLHSPHVVWEVEGKSHEPDSFTSAAVPIASYPPLLSFCVGRWLGWLSTISINPIIIGSFIVFFRI